MLNRELVNIIEYLALGEIQICMSTEHPHQTLFYKPIDEQILLQHVLNRIPAIYMWLAPEECPSMQELSTSEQDQLRTVVHQEIHRQLEQVSGQSNPHSSLMTEMFY